MIGNFEIRKPVLSLSDQIVNMSDLSAITDIFLCPVTSYFTYAQFIDETSWQYFAANNFHIKNIVEINSQIEEPTFITSRFNFRYQSKPGKYRFLCQVNVDTEYYERLKKIDNRLFGIYLKDVNNNLIGLNKDGYVYPLTLENFTVNKIDFGHANQASLTGLYIDFYDANEFKNIYIQKTIIDFSSLEKIYQSEKRYVYFTKDDCPEGYMGSDVLFTAPARMFTSTISQADANNQAEIYIGANGQAYANANGTCILPPTIYWNTEQSGTFTRNNCGYGYEGSEETYTIAAHTYSSEISQEDADNEAMIKVNLYGQGYANSEGTCSLILDYLIDTDEEIFTDFKKTKLTESV